MNNYLNCLISFVKEIKEKTTTKKQANKQTVNREVCVSPARKLVLNKDFVITAGTELISCYVDYLI